MNKTKKIASLFLGLVMLFSFLSSEIINPSAVAVTPDSLNERISEIGAFTSDKKEQLSAIYEDWLTLSDEYKAQVKNISSVKTALEQFENGAYFYDDFENGLNWQLSAPITGTSYDDNLTPTNEYSAEAAKNEGDENGNAFWGIHSSKEDSENNVLWLRKSFNANNVVPTSNNNQNKPSVSYITKDVLPENAKISFISGKMYVNDYRYFSTGYKQFVGIAYKYSGEYSWAAIGSRASYLGSVSRSSESTGTMLNNAIPATLIEGDAYTNVKANQWVDFRLEYDFRLSAYTYKLTFENADGEVKTSKYRITGSAEFLTEVALINAAPTMQSFDDISVGLLDNNYIETLINDLPAADSVTLDDEDAVIGIKNLLDRLSEDEKSQLSNLDRFNAAYNKILQLKYDIDRTLDPNAVITFESDELGANYFETVNAMSVKDWGAAENPQKTGVNTSDKSLMLTRNYSPSSSTDNNFAIYKIKDAVLYGSPQISNLSGKVYISSSNNAVIIYDYADENHWKGYMLGFKNGLVVYDVTKSGEGKNYYQAKNVYLSSENRYFSFPANTQMWVEFDIHYQLTEVQLSVRLQYEGEDYIYQYATWTSLLDTNATKFAFGTTGTGYVDDINVNFQGNDSYYAAKRLLDENDYILDLLPASKYVSVTDKIYIDKLVDDYNALSDEAKRHIPFMNSRIDNIVSAYEAIDPQGAAAIRDNQLLANKEQVTGNYSSFEFSDDFENGLSAWMPAKDVYMNAGSVSVEYCEALGSNALKVTGNAIITPKTTLLPEKPQIEEISFRLICDESSTISFTSKVFLFTGYTGVNSYSARGFYPSSTNKAYDRPKSNGYDLKIYSTGLDMYTVWQVTYKSNLYVITDENGNSYEIPVTISDRSLFALGGLNSAGFYVDDLTVKYKKGDYEDAETNEDISVYYSGNTLQSADDYVMLDGDNLGELVSQVWVSPLENTASVENRAFVAEERFDRLGALEGEWSKDPVAHAFNEDAAVRVDITQKTDNCIKFLMPAEFKDGSKPETAVYAVKLIGTDGSYRIVYVNRPVISYTVGSDGEIVSPGTQLRVIGNNLAPFGTDSADKLKAVLVRNGVEYVTEVSEVQSNYSVSVDIPEGLESGDYELWLYSGMGDDTCWAEPVTVKIDAPVRDSWSSKQYNLVTDFGATGDGTTNDTPAFVRAFTAISQNGGGTLYLPSGIYTIVNELYIPENCRIIGENDYDVVINLSPLKWDYNSFPSRIFYLKSNVEFKNIRICGSRVGNIFAVRGANDRKNIYFENVYMGTNPIDGPPSDSSTSTMGLLSSAELKTLLATENGYIALNVGRTASNVILKNVTITHNEYYYGKNITVTYPGSEYWQLDNVSLDNGWSEAVLSKTLWENCDMGENACMGVWGYGVYSANNRFHDQNRNNRELFVGDHDPEGSGTIYPVEGDTTGTKFYINSLITKYGIASTGYGQVYIVSGQGLGQTRMTKKIEPVTVDGKKMYMITLTEPFFITPNKSSKYVIRRPREKIFFVNNEYSVGNAGGFYGGFADVVYDGCSFTGVNSFYQRAWRSDRNWYLSYINMTYEYLPTAYFPGSVQSRLGTYNYSDSTPYGAICFLMRDCTFKGVYSQLEARGRDAMVDVIWQRNTWYDIDYPLSIPSSRSDINSKSFNGLLFADNLYPDSKELSDYPDLISQLKSATNLLGSKRLIITDEVQSNFGKIYGDVNFDGKVTVKDATLIAFYVAGKIELNEEQLDAADVDGNGKVTLKDASLIKFFVLEKIESFPAAEQDTSSEDSSSEDSSSEDSSSEISSSEVSSSEVSSSEDTSSDISSSDESSSSEASESSSSSSSSSSGGIDASSTTSIDDDSYIDRYY